MATLKVVSGLLYGNYMCSNPTSDAEQNVVLPVLAGAVLKHVLEDSSLKETKNQQKEERCCTTTDEVGESQVHHND